MRARGRRGFGWKLWSSEWLYNPGAHRFLEKLGSDTAVQDTLRKAGRPSRKLWDHMCDGEDCSVARGIGLAVANSGYLRALEASTVRPPPESPLPKHLR